ncbi:LRR 8 domain containing protein [Asbolus verrucosus]|uniref:LRR 8 domain containing protein n=1 Tax=Asbolus verrucosus TaxID=1661398 RepID=A0A482VG18_ASBVE|nr:LRR 8 domain containing protein [Asbolus verrucosus]
MVFCECVSDLNEYNIRNWTEVVLGSRKVENNTCSSFTISRDTFENFEEIKLLFIVNQVNNIYDSSFRTIGQTLKYLIFYGNNLKTIKTGTFSGFRQLNRLGLVNNNIETLEEYAFRDSLIENLDLSNNKIRAIESPTFHNCEIIQITIQNNNLSFIISNAFNEHLEVLHLDYNNIETIENGFVGNSPKLKEFTISHNKLTHISDISSLEKVKKLDFSFNDINFINNAQFEELKDLIYLDLSNNKLEQLSLKSFKKVKTERMTLLLSYNLLTNLKITDIKPITVTLFGNPWNCDCLTKLEKEIIQHNFTRTKCDVELFKNGNIPICLDQGECQTKPVENRSDLQRFLEVINRSKKHLPCDLFHEVGGKNVVSVRSKEENGALP